MTARRPKPKSKGKLHRCPVEGCQHYHGPDKVLCRVHWFKSPRRLREAVWEAYYAQSRTQSLSAIRRLLKWHAETVPPAPEGGQP